MRRENGASRRRIESEWQERGLAIWYEKADFSGPVDALTLFQEGADS